MVNKSSADQDDDAVGSLTLWLSLKLSSEWSSSEVASLINLNDTQNTSFCTSLPKAFPTLEPSIKIRTLLLFLAFPQAQYEKTRELGDTLNSVLKIASEDSDQWVKIASGLVKQWRKKSHCKDDEKVDFLTTKSNETIEKLLSNYKSDDNPPPLECSLEQPYLKHPSNAAALEYPTNIHFNVVSDEEDEQEFQASPTHNTNSTTTNSSTNATSIKTSLVVAKPSTSTGVVARFASLKQPIKSTTPSSSTGRNSSSRFHRKRSRIAVLDLDEVKKIEEDRKITQSLHMSRLSTSNTATTNEEERNAQLASLLTPNIMPDGSTNAAGTSVIAAPAFAVVSNTTTATNDTQGNNNSVAGNNNTNSSNNSTAQYPPGFGAPPAYWN